MPNSHPARMLFSTFIGIDLMLMTSAFSSRLQICSAISFGGDIETRASTVRKLNFTGSQNRDTFKFCAASLNFALRVAQSCAMVLTASPFR
jgi:hypothetical protein